MDSSTIKQEPRLAPSKAPPSGIGLSAVQIICALLILGTLIAYGQVWGFQFVNYDDNEYVYDNPFIKNGISLHGIAWACKTGFTGNWIPVTWLSHMFAAQIFGLDAGAHHLLNVAIHIANSILLFLLLRRMSGALWPSAIMAALFAWHPLHVESVAWVTERKDTLSTLFFLLTIWAYVRYVENRRAELGNANAGAATDPRTASSPSIYESTNPSIHSKSSRFYTLSLLFFTLGLMSKSMLVTVPFLLLLLDFWPLRRLDPINPSIHQSINPSSIIHHPSFWPLVREKTRFLLLAVIVCAITIFEQKHFGTMDPAGKLPLPARLANAAVSCARYLEKTFWPHDLTVFYPYPGDWPAWQIIGAVALLVLCSLIAIRSLRSQPWLAVGWFWFLGTLVPVIGIVQVGRQAMADRYTYIPLIGFFIAVVWGVSGLLKKIPATRPVVSVVAGLVLLACLASTYAQTRHWQNSVRLWTRAIAVTKKNSLAEYNLGHALEVSGQVPGAIQHYKQALQYYPGMYQAHVNLGSKEYDFGNYSEATNHLIQALTIRPDLTVAYPILAKALAALHDFSAADAEFARASVADPNNINLQQAWADALIAAGKPDEAGEHIAQVLRIQFPKPEDQMYVGYNWAIKQKGLAGVAYYHALLRINPDVPEVLNNLAWLRTSHPDPKVRDGVEAVKYALRACEITQYRGAVLVGTLGAAYAETGQFDKARQMAQKAIELAQATGQTEIAKKNQDLLKLYESGKPFHETSE